MAAPHYVIRGGLEGRERLRVLARGDVAGDAASCSNRSWRATRGASTSVAVEAT